MLKDFLNAKPLYYDEIDYSRMPRVYETIKHKLTLPKIIHLIGTNGKGTTGRFLATALYSTGHKVGHYSSPHILEFNERIWKNGKNINNVELEEAHNELLNILDANDAEALSYFEYTTLLAMIVYKDVEYVVLEAGLGGEYDATAVFEKVLTLVTPIGIDHEAFLGDSIESIATTKLNAIQNQAIIAKQRVKEVYEVALDIETKKEVIITRVDEFITDSDRMKITKISDENSLVEYLVENLTLAISALKYLSISYSVESFTKSKLYGRLTYLNKNILLDVGHNVLAARAIVKSLENKKYTLIYNSYKDKNYQEILSVLQPILVDVEIIEVLDSRIESVETVEKVVETLSLKCSRFQKVDKNRNYLVFGSFSVAEAFLKVYNE